MVGTAGYLVVSILDKMSSLRLKKLSCHSCSQALGLAADISTLAQTWVLIPEVVLVFLQYEVQDWQIYFFLKGCPGRHLVDCMMRRLKTVARSMMLGHLKGLG